MGKSGVVQWDFWVNLNLTVKGKTRPQRVILEKNISGRTCILLNATCCTYITDEVHSTNLTNAVGRLVDLQQAMSEDRKSTAGKAWWEWLGFGGRRPDASKGSHPVFTYPSDHWNCHVLYSPLCTLYHWKTGLRNTC